MIAALKERGLWPQPQAKRKIVACYGYEDGSGKLLFQVVRYDPKDFRVRRPDGHGGWVWDMGDVQRVLYRLPELLSADTETIVYVTEGEKDVDKVVGAGLVATTTPQGASRAHLCNLSPLAGRHVVILPDNDHAGRSHAQQVAQAIYKVARSVKVVELPGAGKDVSDWLNDGHPAQELVALAEAAPPWTPPAQPLTDSAATVQVRCLADVVAEAVTWLWHPYIPIGKLTLLEGDPGVGKSWVTLAIATAVSLGRGLPGGKVGEPGNVLLASAEDGLADTIRPRLDAMGADVSRIYALDGALTLDDVGLPSLEVAIVKHRPVLVVLDPLVAYLGANVDMHRANETRHMMAALARLAETHSLAMLAVRHLTKGGATKPIYRGLGSIDFTAACRSVLLAGSDPDNPTSRGIVHIKSNLAPTGPSIGYELRDGRFYWTGESTLTITDILAADDGTGTSKLEEAEAFLRDVLSDGPVPAAEVWRAARDADLKDKTVNRAKAALGVRAKRLGEQGRRGGGKWAWALPGHLDGQDGHTEDSDHLNPSKAEKGVSEAEVGPLNGIEV